jgi:hypothetical protein
MFSYFLRAQSHLSVKTANPEFFFSTSSNGRSHEMNPRPPCAFESLVFLNLQFTPVNAVCCVLHRSTSRVIHRSANFFYSIFSLLARNGTTDYSRSYLEKQPNNGRNFFLFFVNDPAAGSPTATLLRLLLPLNGTVWSSFGPAAVRRRVRSVRRSH